ncbi:hypothetical protein B7463_g158, partial [Scytalidium lignicola]
MAPPARVRPYKDFLTPALHRRFAKGTAFISLLCYAEAVIIGPKNSLFWSWFPLGMAGIRTGLLFICAFSIFILRVAQLHVGLRTTNSGLETFVRYAPRWQTIQTIGWYFFSAWFFSEIFIWSASESANLNRIISGARTGRPNINERPIYLTSFLLLASLLQAAYHLFYDYDRINMPVTKTKPQSSSDQRPHLVVPPRTQLKNEFPRLALSALKRAGIMTVICPILYSITIPIIPFVYSFNMRHFAWGWTRMFAKIFWNLPKSTSLPTIGPFHYTVLFRTFEAGFLLILMWEVGNTAFSAYVAQEPLKNDRPITYESRDPNGSLLTGLKGKKLQTRAFAFWELVYIAQRFEGRRKVIFEDIDRTGGSAWSQILNACLEQINGVTSRINESQNHKPKEAAVPTIIQDPAKELPRLTQPLKDGLQKPGDLFTASPPPTTRAASVAQSLETFAKTRNVSPGEGGSLRAKAIQATEKILTPQQQAAVSPQGIKGFFMEYAASFLRTPFGLPFQQTYCRRITTIVLGSPYGDVLTSTVTTLERFKGSIGFHWTDVDRKMECPEVDTLLAALKGGLHDLLVAFGDFSRDLRLSAGEMRMAREAAAVHLRREMQETKEEATNPKRREMQETGQLDRACHHIWQRYLGVWLYGKGSRRRLAYDVAENLKMSAQKAGLSRISAITAAPRLPVLTPPDRASALPSSYSGGSLSLWHEVMVENSGAGRASITQESSLLTAPIASAALKARVRRPSLLKKLAHPEDLLSHFPNGAYIGWSGFTGVGYPKKIPTMLADHVENNGLQGKLKYSLFVGASSGAETENRWAALNMIERRAPHQVGKEIAKGINNGNIKFFDKHLSMFPVDLVYMIEKLRSNEDTIRTDLANEDVLQGFYTKDKPNNKLDVVIVEATAITEDGGIVPGASVGASAELIQMADKIIVEVNTSMPSFEGLHDITMTDLPPGRKPYLIMAPEDRIGTTYIPVDSEKIVAIVESDYQDQTQPNSPADASSEAIASHLIEFLEHEVAHGRLPKNLLPIQSGIGNIANAVIGGLANSKFEKLKVWTEVLQDTFLDLFDSDRLDFATATSIRFSPEGFKRFYDGWERYHNKLLLRSQQVSNSPEIIRRLGVIGMNTPVEVDIYAHANSTCVFGSRMLNGLGGSADFLRSSKYSIMHTPSTRPSKTDKIGTSCIVPMCTHVDQTEHDLDVIVTEQGLADVRGLSPRERARVIIQKCAHPEYQPILEDYFRKAEFECLRRGWGHEPHLLWNSFDMHKALDQEGSMRALKTWG